jgi:hypothetical protein
MSAPDFAAFGEFVAARLGAAIGSPGEPASDPEVIIMDLEWTASHYGITGLDQGPAVADATWTARLAEIAATLPID